MELLTFVSYFTELKAYRLLDSSTNKITISRDVKFVSSHEMFSEEIKLKKQTDLQNKDTEIQIYLAKTHQEKKSTTNQRQNTTKKLKRMKKKINKVCMKHVS